MTDPDPVEFQSPGVGLENISEKGSNPPARKVEYRHTIVDLEAELNRTMVRDCKIDACIDLFLCRVLSFRKNNPDGPDGEGWYSTWLFRDMRRQLPAEKLEPMTQELRQNLDRLVPGHVSNGEPVLDAINDRVEIRWNAIQMSREAPIEQSIPQSLVQTLAEKQFKERTGLGATTSPEERTSLKNSSRQLRSLIEGESATASFSCGGTIPVAVDSEIADGKNLTASPPVRIFWSKRDDATAQKLILPIGTSVPEVSAEILKRLVADCDPASFGRGDKDVVDPEYRKAGKLDTDQFATSFHPADFGILDTVGQVLLPSISSETDNQLQFRRIKAELYKMNVCLGCDLA
jgi:hypothetical protein